MSALFGGGRLLGWVLAVAVAVAVGGEPLIGAQRLILRADGADVTADGAELAVAARHDVVEPTQTPAHDGHEHLLTGAVLRNAGCGVEHPLAHGVEVLPARGDDLRGLVHLGRQPTVEATELADDALVLGVGVAVDSGRSAGPV